MDKIKKLPNLLLAARFFLQFLLIQIAFIALPMTIYGFVCETHDPYHVYQETVVMASTAFSYIFFLWKYRKQTQFRTQLKAATKWKGYVIPILLAFCAGIVLKAAQYAVMSNLFDITIKPKAYIHYDGLADCIRAQFDIPNLVENCFALLIGPIIEELICRFHLTLHLQKAFGRIWSAVISSVIFMVMHLNTNPTAMIFHLVGGFFFYLIYCKSGSLLCAIAAHMGANFYITLLTQINITWFVKSIPFTIIACCVLVSITIWLLIQKDRLTTVLHDGTEAAVYADAAQQIKK